MQADDGTRVQVHHDGSEGRFYARVDGREAELHFRDRDDGTLELVRTFVPTELRGRGVGGELVRGALDWARSHGRHVLPTCPFVRAYLERHPDDRDLVAGAR